MQDLLHLAVSDADHVMAMIRAHSPRSLARLAGYVLVARSIDEDGRLVSHTLTPAAQPRDTTAQILNEGDQAITPS